MKRLFRKNKEYIISYIAFDGQKRRYGNISFTANGKLNIEAVEILRAKIACEVQEEGFNAEPSNIIILTINRLV